MSFLFNLSSTNISYYTVPVAFVLALAPHSYSLALAGKRYNYADPRSITTICEKDEKLAKQITGRIKRAQGAATNGFETLGFFAAGVAAANFAGVPVATVNGLALAYLGIRAVYNYIYVVLNENRQTGPLRTLVWLISIGVTCTLFIKAGNAMNSK